MRSQLLVSTAATVAILAWAGSARAYPQFQFSSGTTRCSQCHYSPSGGTLITSWGRDEAGDTISLAGDGAFLHGLWTPPSWLALGGDLRLAGIVNDVGGPESPETAAFPMQFDLYGRVAFTESLSLNVTVGDRGVVRPPDPSLSGRSGDFVQRLMSREHYLMWRPSASGPYVRLGRFYAPYGLRLVEHITFIRRYTGYNLYEETYNASGGYVVDDFEVHATLFTHAPNNPEFIASVGPHESGFVGYGEKRFNGMASLGAQTRIAIATEQSRYQGGAVGKLWVEKVRLLFMGEGDFIRQQLRLANVGQNQFVSYLGATFFIRGVLFGGAYERFQEDLAVKETGRNAFDLQLNVFPYAHIELVLLGRYQKAGTPLAGSDPTAGWLGMLQLHYYL
jgi:hypothetical protein